MAIIGTFTKADEKFSGELKTLSLKAKISIVPTALDGENTPDFRVMAGTTEIGAGWVRTSSKGKDYVSLKLDDPTFAAPVYANLVERQDKHVLIWNR
tara:strand:+ start:14054 stop:14344 length:291 start_codon:yes stop_codon:yes gene_type:complete